MPTYNTNSYIARAVRIDNGVEMQLGLNTVSYPTRQLCCLDIDFTKPHEEGKSIFDTEPYYNVAEIEDNPELCNPDVHFGEHEIDYLVTGFGANYDELEYGLSYSDIVIVVYALDFLSDSNNAGKNPFYYTDMEGSDGMFGIVLYDTP